MGVSFQDRNPKDAIHPRSEERGILACFGKAPKNRLADLYNLIFEINLGYE
jgi:hypothetical protein